MEVYPFCCAKQCNLLLLLRLGLNCACSAPQDLACALQGRVKASLLDAVQLGLDCLSVASLLEHDGGIL